MAETLTQPELRHLLLASLAGFSGDRAAAPRQGGMHLQGGNLFSYCALERERLVSVTMPVPLIGIVLSGSKEVWLGDMSQSLLAGDVFVLPGAVALDVVNIPDARSGLYETLLLPVPELPVSLRSVALRAREGQPGCGFSVALGPDLVEALAHSANALAQGPLTARIAEHRLCELLILLVDAPQAAPLFRATVADRVRWLVASAPEEPWTAREIGRRLGMSNSTLRRKLAEQGEALRSILADVRMQVAREMLMAGGTSVTTAAQAAGYTSRSHFARRFRQSHGIRPHEVRRSAVSRHGQ